MLPTTAEAGTLTLLDLREFSFEGYHLADRRDSYFPYEDGEWKGGTAVNFNLDLAKYRDWGLTWDNAVFGHGTYSQYRETGWRYEIGFDAGSKVRLFWRHESRHLLDESSEDKFPLTNQYGAKITFFERGVK